MASTELANDTDGDPSEAPPKARSDNKVSFAARAKPAATSSLTDGDAGALPAESQPQHAHGSKPPRPRAAAATSHLSPSHVEPLTPTNSESTSALGVRRVLRAARRARGGLGAGRCSNPPGRAMPQPSVAHDTTNHTQTPTPHIRAPKPQTKPHPTNPRHPARPPRPSNPARDRDAPYPRHPTSNPPSPFSHRSASGGPPAAIPPGSPWPR